MKELLNRLRAAFANLSDQERLLVTCAGLALLIAVLRRRWRRSPRVGLQGAS